LRASYARSYLFLEEADAALVEYLFILDHPDREFIDFVWFDAALLLAHADDFDRAEELLHEFLEHEPGDEQAEKLLEDIAELRS
jgi:tetratricopeptide (TPR) repeat protein